MKIKLWETMDKESIEALRQAVNARAWYHVIDLKHGILTPGQYDMRPLLPHYGFPSSFKNKTVLDVGPAHGFFSFEFERRGAARVCTAELPSWAEHDASDDLKARHLQDEKDESSQSYHAGTIGFAIEALGSKVERKFCNVYDLGPDTTGIFDIVFCGSVLLHLTDPLRAMYGIHRATREYAIIATGIDQVESDVPRAQFYGEPGGQAFWFPNMTCLERMAIAAGFARVERVSEFMLTSVDGVYNTPHGVIRAYK